MIFSHYEMILYKKWLRTNLKETEDFSIKIYPKSQVYLGLS